MAHRAGVGVGTVYRHFPDVKAVVDAQLDQRVETLCQSIQAIGPIEDPIEELRQVLVSIGELQAADRAVFQVIAQAMTPEQYERIHDRLRPLITRVVERAKATGRLRADFASSDIPMIMHMLRAVTEYTQDVRPDLWRRYLEVIIDGFLDDADDHQQPRRSLNTPPLLPRQGEQIVAARTQT